MKCLSAEQIYSYIEEDLPEKKREIVHAHIAECEECRKALEERAFLLDTAESIPHWETPAEFTGKTMALLLPDKISVRKPLLKAAVGIFAAAIAGFSYLLISGQSLLLTAFGLSRLVLTSVKSFSIWVAKSVKLAYVVLKAIWEIGTLFLSEAAQFSHILKPEFRIILWVLAAAAYLSLFLGIRKTFSAGEQL